jgi:hypothetical protein
LDGYTTTNGAGNRMGTVLCFCIWLRRFICIKLLKII